MWLHGRNLRYSVSAIEELSVRLPISSFIANVMYAHLKCFRYVNGAFWRDHVQ